MRKLLFFLLVAAFATGVNAQSSYDRPWPGALHFYTANVSDSENDNPVRWWVSIEASGNNKAAHGTDYTFISPGYNPATDRLEAIALYAVQISWGANLTDGQQFYIVLEVDDKASGCTNRMALPVVIDAAFNARVWNVTGSASPGTVIIGSPSDDVTNPTCPEPVVNPLWNGSGHTDIGSSMVVFRIERQYSLFGWQFEFAVSEGTSKPMQIEEIRFTDQAGNALAVASQPADLRSGVVQLDSGSDYALAYVRIRNQQGVTLLVNFDLVTLNGQTRDEANNPDELSVDNDAEHTIRPMPVIANFGGN